MRVSNSTRLPSATSEKITVQIQSQADGFGRSDATFARHVTPSSRRVLNLSNRVSMQLEKCARMEARTMVSCSQRQSQEASPNPAGSHTRKSSGHPGDWKAMN